MDNIKYNQKKIAFAGGSTGGHVVPISTLIKEMISRSLDSAPLRSGWQGLQVFWFGERGSLEERECGKLNDNDKVAKGDPSIRLLWGFQGSVGMTDLVQFIPIVSGKLRRKPNFKELLQNIADLFKFIYGIVISLFFLIKYRIDSIFSKWGFVSLPVVIAWWILRIPIVVHESDSRAGISTKIAAMFASKVFTGFPGVLEGGEYVGQILSSDLVQDWEKLLKVEKTSVLVNCGSLGSASVHEALLALFKKDPTLTEQFYRIILLGKLNAWYGSDYSQYPDIERYDYIDQTKMGELYMKADISICRGGSTTLVEQHIFGIKQIIIPIPWTHDQAGNAEFFVKEYADIVLDQNKKDRITELWNNLKSLVGYRKWEVDAEKVSEELARGRERIVEYLMG